MKTILLADDPDSVESLVNILEEASHGLCEIIALSDWPAEPAGLVCEQADCLLLCRKDLSPPVIDEISGLCEQAHGAPLVVWAQKAGSGGRRSALQAGSAQCLVSESPKGQAIWRAMRRAAAGADGHEGLFESVFHHMQELVCRFDAHGGITVSNRSFRRYFGLGEQQGREKRIFELVRHEDHGVLRNHLALLNECQPQCRLELRCRSAGGGMRWLGWGLHALFDADGVPAGFQAVGVDVTERKQVEQALLTAESSLRQAFTSNSDGMVVTDLEGRVLYVNPSAEALLGKAGNELLGRRFPYPLSQGRKQEIRVERADGHLIVEVRVALTKWQRREAYLASLRDLTELVSLREELRSLSLEDDLTGLYNRRGFFTLGRQQMKTASRMGQRLVLFFLDMDDLKAINDLHGHAKGDQAIRETALVLKATFRESDILGRYGGDEFVALAMESDEDGAEAITRRLEQNLDDWNTDASRPYTLGLSVGVAYFEPERPCTLQDMVSMADRQMYESKKAKKQNGFARRSGPAA